MNKKIVFIGGGASSLIASIFLKQREPSFGITIVEKDKKLGKKLSATGGGKCNIAPLNDDIVMYNNESKMLLKSLFRDISMEEYFSLLKEVGIEVKQIKDYGYYPIHESAPQLVKNLIHRIRKLGIEVIQDEFIDYKAIAKNEIEIELKNSKISGNCLVLATGGMNEDIKNMLSKKGYVVSDIYPGLCPTKVKEKVSSLFGCRFDANINLFYDNKMLYHTYGEVQFKKDALSGIPLLNCSSVISRNLTKNRKIEGYEISIGLNPNLANGLMQNIIGQQAKDFLMKCFKEEYVDYLLTKENISPETIITKKNQDLILKMVFDNRFKIDSLYDIESAQISVGGFDLNQINENFMLNNENNIYVVGEMLNVDGFCGGYNLRFAISSGLKAALSILK